MNVTLISSDGLGTFIVMSHQKFSTEGSQDREMSKNGEKASCYTAMSNSDTNALR